MTIWYVHHEPGHAVYGLPTVIEYPTAEMAVLAAEGLRQHTVIGRVWVEEVASPPDPSQEETGAVEARSSD